jgi:hypothetical protein
MTAPLLAIMQGILALTAINPFSSVSASIVSSAGLPLSYAAFSSAFQEPEPPVLVTDIKSHFMQHKWYESEVMCIVVNCAD